MKTKILFLLVCTLLIVGCAPSDTEQAQVLVQQAQTLVDNGQWRQARIVMDSLHATYPREVAQRRVAKALGDSDYTALTANAQFFGADVAKFDLMFRMHLWAGDITNNHEVYATDVWGVTIVDGEIADWEAAGAVKLGSALNSSEALAETLGGLAIYKTNGGFNKSIANLNIVASDYTQLYFAYKTNKAVTLSNTDGQNGNKAGVWYFVKLEKQADGSWTIAAKAFGDSSYTTLTANAQLFGTNATFDSMFKTNLWTNDAYNHEVYATDVWGVTTAGGEVAAWEAAGAEADIFVINNLSADAVKQSVEEFANGVEVRFKSSRTYVIATDGNIYNSREDIPINKTPEQIKEDKITGLSAMSFAIHSLI